MKKKRDIYFIRSCKYDLVPPKLYKKTDGLYFWWCDVTMEWVEIRNLVIKFDSGKDTFYDRVINESELFTEML